MVRKMCASQEFGKGSTSRLWDNEHKVQTGHRDNLHNLPPIRFDIYEVGFPVNKRPDRDFVPALLLKPSIGAWCLAAIIQNNLESVMKSSPSLECTTNTKVVACITRHSLNDYLMSGWQSYFLFSNLAIISRAFSTTSRSLLKSSISNASSKLTQRDSSTS